MQLLFQIERISPWFAVVPAALLAAGCATGHYENPNLKDPVALARQKAVDEGYCKRVSHGAAPMPQVRYYTPEQQSYAITGTINSYNYNTGHTNSTYTAHAAPQTTPAGGFAAGFAQGMANGANLAAAFAADEAQRKIYHGCMMSLGWIDTSTAEGKQLFEQAQKQVEQKQTAQKTATAAQPAPYPITLQKLQEFYDSATGWQRVENPEYTARIGDFDSSAITPNSVGIVSEIKANNASNYQKISFDVFDCARKLRAVLGILFVDDNENLIRQHIPGTAQFEPAADGLRPIMQTYCEKINAQKQQQPTGSNPFDQFDHPK